MDFLKSLYVVPDFRSNRDGPMVSLDAEECCGGIMLFEHPEMHNRLLPETEVKETIPRFFLSCLKEIVCDG
jgi:hypothetical protein